MRNSPSLPSAPRNSKCRNNTDDHWKILHSAFSKSPQEAISQRISGGCRGVLPHASAIAKELWNRLRRLRAPFVSTSITQLLTLSKSNNMALSFKHHQLSNG